MNTFVAMTVKRKVLQLAKGLGNLAEYYGLLPSQVPREDCLPADLRLFSTRATERPVVSKMDFGKSVGKMLR